MLAVMRVLFALLSLCLALPGAARAEQVTVFAAASLATAFDAIAPAFEAATGHRLVAAFAGSSALARQIDRGAPADLFIPASADWMDWLTARGRIDPNRRFDLLGNRLVLVAHGAAAPAALGPAFDLAGRLGDGRLAMALVDAVPAGSTARRRCNPWASGTGWRRKVAQADNVRAALALVALGAAPLGVVYATDAAAEPRVSVIGTFPADSHPPIVYPAAPVVGADGPPRPPSWPFCGPRPRAPPSPRRVLSCGRLVTMAGWAPRNGRRSRCRCGCPSGRRW
jgi:molybdate transport system substrate-binding protein